MQMTDVINLLYFATYIMTGGMCRRRPPTLSCDVLDERKLHCCIKYLLFFILRNFLRIKTKTSLKGVLMMEKLSTESLWQDHRQNDVKTVVFYY